MFANLKSRQNKFTLIYFVRLKSLCPVSSYLITYIGIEEIERHRTTPQFNRGVFSAWHHLPRELS